MAEERTGELALAELRREYQGETLDERTVDPDPLAQFRHWFDEALRAEARDPNAMVLATADAGGQPSARVVLLKALDDRGFVFFGGLTGRKSRELQDNPQAALLFYWSELTRQVRVRGTARRVPDAEAAAYFTTRPRPSRLAAWASLQSDAIDGRAALEARLREMQQRFGAEEGDVPLPPHWGGWLVVPRAFEFWQGRPGRLHDRITYDRLPDGSWKVGRLAP